MVSSGQNRNRMCQIQLNTEKNLVTIELPICTMCKGKRLIASDMGSPGENYAICSTCNGRGYLRNFLCTVTSNVLHDLLKSTPRLHLLRPSLPLINRTLQAKVYWMEKGNGREPDPNSGYITVENFLRGHRPKKIPTIKKFLSWEEKRKQKQQRKLLYA